MAVERGAALSGTALSGTALSGNETEALVLSRRQEKAAPLLVQFRAWLGEQRDRVLPKSPIGEALSYTLGNWEALARYTEAGVLAIDNNVAEREMKRVAIGRKNFLFVGSDKGGQTAAILFSFTSSCQRHGLDPFAYFREVLDRLAAGNLSRGQLAALLPKSAALPTS